MNSIIKNISKILALTVFSTNFSPMILASSPESSFDFSRVLSGSMSTDDTNDFHSIPLRCVIECELTKLKTHNVFATEAFMQQVKLDIQQRILHQLNVLFDDYPIVFTRYFNSYLAATASWRQHSTPGKFMIDVMPTRYARQAESVGRLLGGRLLLTPTTSCMQFNCAGKNAAMFRTPPSSLRALPQYSPGKYIEFQVAHEFGHCIQTLFLSWTSKAFTESPIETQQFIQRTLADTNLASRLGTRWQRPSYDSRTQASEFFADFFAYVHCGENVPENYKTVLDQVINRWFPILLIHCRPSC